MTDDAAFGDALTAPFWSATRRHELAIQQCTSCNATQFYPRPFCVKCYSDQVEWVVTAGTGVVYSRTIVQIALLPELDPPYAVALIDLDEGPRILANLIDGSGIGDRVAVRWRSRGDQPPLPVFAATDKEDGHGTP